MGFFKHEKQNKPLNDTPSADPLAAALASNREPGFSDALQLADSLSQIGEFEGIRAIREAIRIRSSSRDVSFAIPTSQAGQPPFYILESARKRALLKDPGVSCGHIANLVSLQRFAPTMGRVPSGHITDPAYWQEGAIMDALLKDVLRAGGRRAGYDFRLLCYELGCRMKLMDSCTRTGRWEEFFKLNDPGKRV